METISMLYFRFSFLIFVLKKGQFYSGRFNPVSFYNNKGGIFELNCSLQNTNSEEDTISLLESLLDNESSQEQPHEIVESWLKLPIVKESLQILNEKASPSKTLQNAIFSVLLCSSALLHYAHTSNKGKKLFKKRSTFLLIAITVLKEINFDVTKNQVITGLQYYIYIVEDLNIEVSYLHDLCITIKNGSEVKKRSNRSCTII